MGGGIVSAEANSGEEMIKAVYKNIKVFVDGQEIDTSGAEPFIYNGTTYLPIRKVGEAFGKAATWNGNTNSVYLGSQPGNESCIFDIMQPYAMNYCYLYYGNDTFEAAGAERKNGFYLDDNSSYITFNLDGKYNGLSFEYVTSIYGANVYVDDVLVQELKTEDSPQKITIPLNGALQIKIKNNSYSNSYFWNVKLY